MIPDDDSDTICIVEFDSGKVTVPDTPFAGAVQMPFDFDSDEPLKGGFCGTDGPCEGCQ